MSMASVVIGIPHAATMVPAELAADMLPRVTEEFLLRESDIYTDEVYSLPNTRWLRYPWHRFVCDPNRGPTQRSDGGVAPTTCFDEKDLYRPGHEPTRTEIRSRVERYHLPYHAALSRLVQSPETRLFLDGHSMAREAPLRSPDRGLDRPDIALGNDGDSRGEAIAGERTLTCSPELLRYAGERLGFWLDALPAPAEPGANTVNKTVKLNDPFAGGYGVRQHSVPEQGIPGIQVELNQRMWIHAETFALLPLRLEWIRTVLTRWVDDLSEHLAKDSHPILGDARMMRAPVREMSRAN
jgi:N-formylglutamate deformylase